MNTQSPTGEKKGFRGKKQNQNLKNNQTKNGKKGKEECMEGPPWGRGKGP